MKNDSQDIKKIQKMVEQNTRGDVFSTADAPKPDSLGNQAIAMPKHEHPLQQQADELDRLFWEKLVAPSSSTAEQDQDALDALDVAGEAEEAKSATNDEAE